MSEILFHPIFAPLVIEALVIMLFVRPLSLQRQSVLQGCRAAGLYASIIGAFCGFLLLIPYTKKMEGLGMFAFLLLPAFLLVPGYFVGLVLGIIGQGLLGDISEKVVLEPQVLEILNAPEVRQKIDLPLFKVPLNNQPSPQENWRDFARRLGI